MGTKIIRESVFSNRQGRKIVQASFLPSGAGQAERARHEQALASYWTPERIARAIPFPLGAAATTPPSPREDSSPGSREVKTAPIQVPDVSQWPYSATGRLLFTYQGQDGWASASALGPNVIMTAGHCVWHDHQWPDNLAFVPQYANGNSPVGTFSALHIWVYDDYRKGLSRSPSAARNNLDYAFIVPTTSMTSLTQFYHLEVGSTSGTAMPLGYPSELQSGQYMYSWSGSYEEAIQPTVRHDLVLKADSFSVGVSGGPWLKTSEGSDKIVGINSMSHPFLSNRIYSPTLDFRTVELFNAASGTNPDWLKRLSKPSGFISQLLVQGDTIYAAVPGYVYRLDAATGDERTRTLVSWSGNYDGVHLASDGTSLFVGTEGTASAWSLDMSVCKWSRHLDSSTMYWHISTKGDVFVGCKGYVWKIDPATGRDQKNSLPGFRYQDIRMDSHEEALYVGSHARVGKIDVDDFKKLVWTAVLSGAGELVHVQVVGQTVYAGSAGLLFLVNTQSGSVTPGPPLPGTPSGKDVVLASDGANVFVGCAGYVSAIDVQSPSTLKWSVQLTSPVARIPTKVLADSGLLFAAANGSVFQLDPGTGQVLFAQVIHSDPREVSVTTDDANLLAGAGDSVFSLAITNATDLISNPGFESGDLTSWTATPADPNYVGVETNYPHSGSYDAYLHPTDGACSLSQAITVPFTSTYNVTAYAATNISSGVTLNVSVNGGTPLQALVSGAGYALYSLSVAANASDTLTISYQAPGSQSGSWATLDDVTVAVVPPSP